MIYYKYKINYEMERNDMKLIQRLGMNMTDSDIDKVLELYTSHPGSCDEIWIPTKYGYPNNQLHKEYAEYWVEKAKKFREKGIGVSMQVSNTLGHGQYMMTRDCSALVYEGSPVRNMVGHDGSVAEYSFCWRDEYFSDYICEHLRYYAEIKPDRVWFDDDFRPTNHSPVTFGCFCDSCMKDFNAKYQSNFTREELVNEFLHGDLVWRKRYNQFVRDGMAEVMRKMCEAIHEISPDTKFGWQHCVHGAYWGDNYNHIFDVMKEVSGEAPASRPGGGVYDDHNPNRFFNKMMELSWQNSMMPDYVKIKAPEIENLPFVSFGKTPVGTAFETSLYMASGNTDMTYSMTMTPVEPWDYYEKFFKVFAQHRDYWNKMSDVNMESYQAGLRIYYPKEIWNKELSENEGMQELDQISACVPFDIIRIGWPIAYDTAEDSVILLHSEIAKLLKPADVEYLKGKCVVTDAESIAILQEKGYNFDMELTRIPDIDMLVMSEKFLNHPTKPERDKLTISFFSIYGPSVAYAMKAGDAEIVAEYAPLKNIPEFFPGDDKPYGVSELVINTDKGGKWAVLGYCPWKSLIPSWARNHYLDMVDYISGDALCAKITTGIPAVISPRKNKDGKTVCVSITNCTIGNTGEIEIIVRNPASEKFYFMSQYDGKKELVAEKCGNDYILKVPSLAPWSVGTIFC